MTSTSWNQRRRVLVLGSGIIGLTTAIRLAERGHKVLIWSKDRSPNLTSDGSGGYWMPFHIEPEELVNEWSIEALRVFRNQSKQYGKECGIHIFPGRVLHEHLPNQVPYWTHYVNMRIVTSPDQVPKEFEGAWKFESPIVNMDVYMPWLEKQARTLGVEILSPRTVGPRLIDAALDAYRHFAAEVLINCTGLGSRELCNDKSVIPGRGATLRVLSNTRKQQRPREFITTSSGPFSSNELPTYILPRGDNLYTLGGTYYENDWNTQVSPEEVVDIQRRCSLLLPEIKDAPVVRTWAGLRPVRPQVRLEYEILDEDNIPLIIHNYGHGGKFFFLIQKKVKYKLYQGAGVTVSWGCAKHVVSLLEDCYAAKERRMLASRL